MQINKYLLWSPFDMERYTENITMQSFVAGFQNKPLNTNEDSIPL